MVCRVVPGGMFPVLEKLVNPTKGGAALVLRGEVTKVNTITDEKTQQPKSLVEVSWWGGSNFFVVEPTNKLAAVPAGR